MFLVIFGCSTLLNTKLDCICLVLFGLIINMKDMPVIINITKHTKVQIVRIIIEIAF